jgi:hypothetical protein
MIEFAQGVVITMAATEKVVRQSKKEYKEQEALRRQNMTPQERSYEDTTKFYKRWNRM